MGLEDLFIDTSKEFVCNATGHGGVTSEYAIPHDGAGFFQLCFLLCVYGYILTVSSTWIADGSELLMLMLNPGLIGGLVLPVMGAIPDGMIVLFSGLGANPQESLRVGVGTLAGSTIMLLTVPWGMCQLVGRVDTDASGTPLYSANPKLTQGWSLTRTGVATSKEIPRNGKIMVATALTYLLIQGPSFALAAGKKRSDAYVAHEEKWWAFAGLVAACVCFLAYSAYMVMSANALDQQEERISYLRKEAFKNQLLSLGGMQEIFAELAPSGRGADADAESASSTLLPSARLRELLEPVFKRFDANGNGQLDEAEVRQLFQFLRIKANKAQVAAVMAEMDTDGDGNIEFDEFVQAMTKWGTNTAARATLHRPSLVAAMFSPRNRVMGGHSRGSALPSHPERAESEGGLSLAESKLPEERPALAILSSQSGRNVIDLAKQDDDVREGVLMRDADDMDSENEEDENEDEEDDDASMTPAQIKMKAFGLLSVGVLVVTIFSDPMVGVMSEIGARLNISSFYVAFIVSPVASNASEFISSMVFASRRTKKSMTLTFSALLGAATMNNTFVLALFLGLVFFNGLMWTFSAEVTSILVVEVAMAVVAMKVNHPTWKAWLVLAMFPASIVLVWFLENVVGWD